MEVQLKYADVKAVNGADSTFEGTSAARSTRTIDEKFSQFKTRNKEVWIAKIFYCKAVAAGFRPPAE